MKNNLTTATTNAITIRKYIYLSHAHWELVECFNFSPFWVISFKFKQIAHILWFENKKEMTYWFNGALDQTCAKKLSPFFEFGLVKVPLPDITIFFLGKSNWIRVFILHFGIGNRTPSFLLFVSKFHPRISEVLNFGSYTIRIRTICPQISKIILQIFST